MQLLSEETLAVLNGQHYDPEASSSYDMMAGGLAWSDEFPQGLPVRMVWAYRPLIAYRASLTLAEGREEFRPVWQQVERSAPCWPGLHPERRGERAKARLLAVKRLESGCLAELEGGLDDPPNVIGDL